MECSSAKHSIDNRTDSLLLIQGLLARFFLIGEIFLFAEAKSFSHAGIAILRAVQNC